MVDMNFAPSTYPAYSLFRCSEQPMMTSVTMDFQGHMQPSNESSTGKERRKTSESTVNMCNMPTTQTREREI